MQIVSIGDNLHEMSNPVFWEDKKKYFKMLSAVLNEPQNKKTYLPTYTPSEDSDLPVHLHPWLSKMCPVQILIRLHERAGRYESSRSKLWFVKLWLK